MENNKSFWKKRGTCNYFLKKLIIDKLEITDTKRTAKTFNNLSVKIGPNLASKIPKSNTNFEVYICKANTKLQENPLAEDEFLEAFKSLKMKKVPGFDKIDVNVITQIHNHIKKPITRIFGDSIRLGVFPEKLKLAMVTPILKSRKNELLTDYRPMSALLCFFKDTRENYA